MQASFADGAIGLVDLLLQLINVAEGQVAAEMLPTTADKRWRSDVHSQCTCMRSVFARCAYLGYGVDVAFLRTARRYRGHAGLLTLIGRNEAEASKQLVSVGAGGDAGGVWTDAQTEHTRLDPVIFKPGMDVMMIKPYLSCVATLSITCLVELPVGVLEVNSGSK